MKSWSMMEACIFMMVFTICVCVGVTTIAPIVVDNIKVAEAVEKSAIAMLVNMLAAVSMYIGYKFGRNSGATPK